MRGCGILKETRERRILHAPAAPGACVQCATCLTAVHQTVPPLLCTTAPRFHTVLP